jgi:hypothetical protein
LVNTNANQVVCVDESLFTHQEGQQTWVVEIINTNNNNILLEIVPNRAEDTLKLIIERIVDKGNVFLQILRLDIFSWEEKILVIFITLLIIVMKSLDLQAKLKGFGMN